MKQAFTYMFKDNKYGQKALMYFGFICIANFASQYARTLMPACKNCFPSPEYFIWCIAGVILSFIPCGYYISCIKALIEQKENFVLPFFNLKNNFIQGFKCSIAIFLLTFIGMTVSILTGVIFAVIFSILNLSALGLIVLCVILAIFILVLLFYGIALTWIFAATGKINSYFCFKKATGLIAANQKNYWIAFGLTVALCIVSGVIAGLLPIYICQALNCSKIILASTTAVIGAAVSSYLVFAIAFITAKAIKPEQ